MQQVLTKPLLLFLGCLLYSSSFLFILVFNSSSNLIPPLWLDCFFSPSLSDEVVFEGFDLSDEKNLLQNLSKGAFQPAVPVTTLVLLPIVCMSTEVLCRLAC